MEPYKRNEIVKKEIGERIALLAEVLGYYDEHDIITCDLAQYFPELSGEVTFNSYSVTDDTGLVIKEITVVPAKIIEQNLKSMALVLKVALLQT